MTRAVLAVVLLLAFASAPTLAAAEGARQLTLSADAASARVGEPVLVEARLVDAAGAPVAGEDVIIDGQVVRTSALGVARASVVSTSEGVRVVSASAPGAPGTTLVLAWLQPRYVLDVPSLAGVGQLAQLRATLLWGANLTPVEGAEIGLALGDVLLQTARTGPLGSASFEVTSGLLGAATYHVVADEPLFQVEGVRASILWVANLTLPDTTSDEAPAVAPVNQPPVVSSVRIALDGLVARAVVGHAVDPDGDPVFLAYNWLVDGLGRAGPSIAVAPGSILQLRVFAVDGRGGTTSVVSDLAVPAHLPPVAVAEARGARHAGEALDFDAGGSSSPSGSPLRHRWTFSDGATAEGSLVRHAFAGAGPAWATLAVEDATGATSIARVDLVLQPAPLAVPEPFPLANGGDVVLLPAGASVERVLAGERPALLVLQTPDGLRLMDAATGELAPVREVREPALAVSYRPQVAVSTLEVASESTATGWTLARVRDPQPGLGFLGAYVDGEAVPWWRDGGDLVVLAQASSVELAHALPPLELEATVTAAKVAYLVQASVNGGAPLRSLRVEGPEGIVVDVTERVVEARIAPTTEDRGYRIVAETVAGERVERAFLVEGEPIELLAQPKAEGSEVAAAANKVPAPTAALILVAFAAAAAALGRRR